MSKIRRRLARFLINHSAVSALAIVTGLPLLLIVLGGFLPVHLTSYMLQSPTKPVVHDWVPRSQINETARRAVVAAEDQKFWQHHGFDVEAMQKAYRGNQRGRRVRGGSTISQQTAKNLFLWPGGGYLRKGIEAGITVAIEALWSKERILEVYLNSAEFGPGIYGVEAAAQRYFHKSAAKLTANESARLAAILPSPRKWKVLSPGPYVASRTAWIQRQMGYGGRAAPVEDFEPLPPPGELQEEDSGTIFSSPVFQDDSPAASAAEESYRGEPAPAQGEPAEAESLLPPPAYDSGPTTAPLEEGPTEAPQPVESE